jgi:hypothetical protein
MTWRLMMGFFLGSNHSKIEYNSNQSKNGVNIEKKHLTHERIRGYF